MEGTEQTVKTESVARKASPDSITSNPDWWPDWRFQACAIIASGPTAKRAPLELLRGKVKVIAINESHQLCPWADMLYGCDAQWWKLRLGVPSFKGLKISQDAQACGLYRDIHKVTVDAKSDQLLIDKPGHLGSGGNGGFQALNLAAQLGVHLVMLIGYDMRVDFGEHWHPRHYPPLSNPHPNDNMPRWRRALDSADDQLSVLGISVVNCSPVSLLKSYPKMTLQEAMRWHGL